PCSVDLYSDSKYLTDAFNKKWIDSWRRRGWKKSDRTPVLNVDLWERLLEAAEPHEIRWIWVKGHAGNPMNERCDRLATSAADAAGADDN
ncbi:MAG: ribonuclease HI, partial [Lachnospiraceae bacterium]|nr:ribonuclease HI [Lachnospiraceae bacterium]